jgi:hypothetical protein
MSDLSSAATNGEHPALSRIRSTASSRPRLDEKGGPATVLEGAGIVVMVTSGSGLMLGPAAACPSSSRALH